ncbi:MAG: MBOAT family O-acyltransferase [Eubacteriales bacterium]|nr:MBOAT family O-acyltransferase [Eubacteriales bacterium]
MVFSSLTFLLLFLPLLYALYFARTSVKWRNGVLLVMSLLFYGWGEPVWILAMILSTAVNFFCARAIVRREEGAARKLILALGVVASLSFLVYFKYSAFLANSVAALLSLSWRMDTPRLPIGISFYTFQILTYTVDVYRGKAPAQKSPLRLLLYISCFPQLIAGPIVQYGDVESQLGERSVTPDAFTEGMERFIKGLAKKVLLANVCGAALEELTLAGTGEPLSLLGAWLAAFLYTLQIYFDFSAYSDMAIGLGKTLGFTYKENFVFPYASLSVTEFWRRWHISLGSFFRDYVYIPLGGNRRGTARTVLNLLIVWGLTGLWHGAAWNFVLWGLYFGVLLILERFVFKPILEKTPGAVRWLLTFVIAVIGWVIFYYTDLPALGQHLCALFGMGVSGLSDAAAAAVVRKYTVYPLIAWVLSLPVVPAVAAKLPQRLRSALALVFSVVLLGASLLFLVGQSYNPFIYFRF